MFIKIKTIIWMIGLFFKEFANGSPASASGAYCGFFPMIST
jgi:hypothetical protein